MTPEQFWALAPQEFWWLFDVNKPQKMYGKMTEDEVKEIYEEAYGEGDQ